MCVCVCGVKNLGIQPKPIGNGWTGPRTYKLYARLNFSNVDTVHTLRGSLKSDVT